MGTLSLSLFRQFRAERDGQPLAGIESAKGRALLAFLAMEAHRPHARSELAWLLWPDVPDAVALTNLRQTLANLRNALGDRTNPIPYLLIERDSIQFNGASDYQLDVAEFRLLLQACQQHRHRHLSRCTSCAQRFECAASLYQGDFLDHFPSVDSEPFEQWVEAQREPLQQEVLVALEQQVAYHEHRGEHEQGLEYARRQVMLAPWHEEGHRKVMQLLARLGRRSAALTHYQRMMEVLDEELGVEPDAESRQLCERLCQGEVNGLETDNLPKHNLPTPSNRFIGREAVLAQLHALLEDPANRLVTVVGPGGIGKTRLALQAASEQHRAYQDGVYFVGLAPIRDPELVVSAIMQVLSLKEEAGQSPLERVKQYLYDKELLLLLDNFEQIVEAAPVVNELLSAAPRLQVLVTSREALHLYGEQEFLVPPLTLPRSERCDVEQMTQYEAVRLFIERARAVKSDFHVTNENAAAVAEICARLDGLPLAIELAAVRSKLLAPQVMLTRLNNRLKLLTGGARDLPARQQTLGATIEWSYNLLDTDEQRLFRRLAVFAGGRTLEAIEVVCNVAGDLPDVLEGISSLVDKNLVRQQEGPEGEPRLVMLETIREYGLGQLVASGEVDTVQHQHAIFYLTLAEAAEEALRGRQQTEWVARLATEHDNVRAALAWSFERGEREIGLRLTGALWRFWDIRGYLTEARRWLAAALAHSRDSSRPVRTRVLQAAGHLARDQGDYAAARSHLTASLALLMELDDTGGIAATLNGLGDLALHQGDTRQARAQYAESLALAQALDDKRGIAVALNGLGEAARYRGDYRRARTHYDASLRMFRELGETRNIATALYNLGCVALAQGDDRPTLALFKESLALFRKLEATEGIALGLTGLAGVANGRGQPLQAARLLGAADALRDSLGTVLEPADRATYDQIMAAVRGQVYVEQYIAAWHEGRAMTLQQALDYGDATLEQAALCTWRDRRNRQWLSR